MDSEFFVDSLPLPPNYGKKQGSTYQAPLLLESLLLLKEFRDARLTWSPSGIIGEIRTTGATMAHSPWFIHFKHTDIQKSHSLLISYPVSLKQIIIYVSSPREKLLLQSSHTKKTSIHRHKFPCFKEDFFHSLMF